MRAVVQRVASASVVVDGESVGAIDGGLLVLLGVAVGDGEADAAAIVDKVVGLRIFPDDEGRMNRSVVDVRGAILLVSQFTLLADVGKGRRPSFVGAADPSVAEPLVAWASERITAAGIRCATGRFGAHMSVRLENDGPVTIVLDALDGRVL
ncbi:MAG TPA: D-aminoacyl-tRNA deacylase [Acidimicrobiia bacterium]|nr:D-aminoacyl-tRNA deacylase [Acidimicrobiia bacterium]